jgi:hypothetical protein
MQFSRCARIGAAGRLPHGHPADHDSYLYQPRLPLSRNYFPSDVAEGDAGTAVAAISTVEGCARSLGERDVLPRRSEHCAPPNVSPTTEVVNTPGARAPQASQSARSHIFLNPLEDRDDSPTTYARSAMGRREDRQCGLGLASLRGRNGQRNCRLVVLSCRGAEPVGSLGSHPHGHGACRGGRVDLVLARWHVLCHSVFFDSDRSVRKAATPQLRRLGRAAVGPGSSEWRDRCARRAGTRDRRVACGVCCRGRRHRRRHRRHLGNGNRTLERGGATPHHDMANSLPRGLRRGYSARHGGFRRRSSAHRLGSGVLGAGCVRPPSLPHHFRGRAVRGAAR